MMERISQYCLMAWALLMLGACSPLPLSQALTQFYAALDKAPVTSSVPLTVLQQLDPLLLRPASLYPQLTELSLPVLSALYQYEQRCTGSLDGVPAVIRQFEQALCQPTTLPSAWFAAHPISPLGGSSAWHYLQRYPAAAASLQSFLHVRERPQALGGIGQLSDDNLDALANGQVWLLQKGFLWRQHQQQWGRYAPSVWQPIAKQVGIVLTAAGERCDVSLGTLCANPLKSYANSWRALLAMAALLTLLALGWTGWQRRRLQQRQRFIVQMLTHELRTPISQLGNVVEYFRRDFDALSPDAQAGFGALADSVQRMRQMAEASQHYLSGDGSRDVLETPSTIGLSEWLCHITEPYDGLTFCLEADQQITLPLYWASLCLTNLLENAFRHGLAPVRLVVRCRKERVIFQVIDAGELTAKSLSQLRRNMSPQAGMGLGLSIVERVAGRLNGKLTLNGPPTTFTLELPCHAKNIID